MGSGIAQLAATAGYEVAVYDASPEQVSRARREIEASLGKLVSKGIVEREAAPQALARLTDHASLEAAAADADVVVEAAAERLPVKQSILAEAASVASPATIPWVSVLIAWPSAFSTPTA